MSASTTWVGAIALGLAVGWLWRWRCPATTAGRTQRPVAALLWSAAALLPGAQVWASAGGPQAAAFLAAALVAAATCHASTAALAVRWRMPL